MPPTAPALLLRLREADIVRLCGLAGAARGLELALHGAVTCSERHGPRLLAWVCDPALPASEGGYATWVEAAESGQADESATALPASANTGGAPGSLRFACACTDTHTDTHTETELAPAGGAGGSTGRACAHVAALLSTWIRHPADFLLPEGERADKHTTATPGAAPAALPAGHHPGDAHPLGRPPAHLARPPTTAASGPLLLADEIDRLPTAEVLAIARRVLGETVVAAGPRETLGSDPDPAWVRATLCETLCDPLLVEALVARLDPLAGCLLFSVILREGVLTLSDVDGIAQRMGRPLSTLQSALDTLERHALLFRVSGRPGASSGQPAGEHSWRSFSGWRMPPDLAPLVVPALPLPSAPTPADLPAHAAPQTRTEGEPSRRLPAPRVRPGSPRALVLALVLLAHAPRPLGPLVPLSTATDVPDEQGGEASALPSSQGVRPLPATRHAGATLPLVPGDLAPQRLAELTRVAGIDPGVARLARRLLLWARATSSRHPLLDAVRLLRPDPDGWLGGLTAGFHLWARAASATELADLDLCRPALRLRVDTAHPAFRPATLAEDGTRARALVLRLLRLARAGQWYRLNDLLDLLWQVHPGFLRGNQRIHATPPWWIEHATTRQPLRATEAAEWRGAEGALVLHLLLGPLSWWGAVDLAPAELPRAGDPDGSEDAIAFRVTPLGHHLLSALEHDVRTAEAPPHAMHGEGRDETRDETREGALALLRSVLAGDWGAPFLLTRAGEVAVQPLAAGAGALDALDFWAEPQAVVANRLIYAPSPDRACLAFDRDLTPDALLAPLRTVESARQAGESRTLRALADRLKPWYAAYGVSRISRGLVLLEAADEAALAEALAYVPAIAARVRQLSPTLALVPADALDTLRERFTRRGYTL